MGFDEPELLINPARHFGKEVRSVGIAKIRALDTCRPIGAR